MTDRVQQTEKELAEQSTALINSATNPTRIVRSLLTLISGRDRSAGQKKLLNSVLEESKRIQTELMERGADAAELQIETAKETHIAERRIHHAHVMNEMNVSATSLQNRAVIGMFEDKKSQLIALDSIDGDAKLKEDAAKLIASMTEQNALKLIHRNRKPKPR